MSEDERRPEDDDPEVQPRGTSAFTRRDDQEGQPVDEFAELVTVLLRLQGERREGLEVLCANLNGPGEDRVAGLDKYLQAQNDIERLMFLMLFQARMPMPELVMPAGTDEATFFETLGRLHSGQGIVVPPGTKIGQRSALDVFAEMSPEAVAAPADHPYLDAANHSLMPKLDGIVTTREGPFDVGGQPMAVTFIEMGANKIPASAVSAIGCIVARSEDVLRECIFVRFKGGDLYRYWPFRNRPVLVWQEMVTICRQMMQALQVPLTVGEYVERVLKTAHDQGLVICEKLEGGKWIAAMTRSELAAHRAAHPPQRGSKKRQRPEDTALNGEPYPEAIRRGGPETPGEGTEGESVGRPNTHPDF
jgi:hypothetical protein